MLPMESVMLTAQEMVAEPPDIEDIVTEYDEVYPALDPADWPQVDDIVTEDDTPVDTFASAKNQRLLVESLYTSWTPARGSQFLVDANVGIFYQVGEPPIVPDVFLSLDVQVAENWWKKQHRSYFVWHFGKSPDVVIEIVSNLVGEEDGRKREVYARIGVNYYVLFDPQEQLQQGKLRVYELQGNDYVLMDTPAYLERIGLGVTVWHGSYEGKEEIWLRWCDRQGNLIPTGRELVEQERKEKEQERKEKEQERKEKEQALSEIEHLRLRLREAGLESEL
jgi:Uma2 family endonuclease